MGQITGSKSIIGVKVASTFGTATAITSGDKLEVENFTRTEGTEELTKNSIGSGLSMQSDSKRGATTPEVSFEKVMGYNDAGLVALAQMFGGASVATIAAGAFQHSILFNETANQKWATVAFQAASATAGSIEYPSVAFTEASISVDNPPNWVMLSANGLANDEKIDSSTNTYATLQAATVANAEPIVIKPQDEFLINVQSSGALTSPTDRVSIVRGVLTFRRAQELVREIKGSTGNAAPVATSDIPFECTLEIEVRGADDLTWWTAHKNETEYKASLTVTGPVIGATAVNYRMDYHLPRLKIVESPSYDLSSPGNNTLTFVMKGLAASAAPTGMVSALPYFLFRNNRSTHFLA